MFIKKYIVSLGLLLIVHNMHAMELTKPNFKQFDEESYLRVALYLNTTTDKIFQCKRVDDKEFNKNQDFLSKKQNFLENSEDNPHAQAVKKYMVAIQVISNLVADDGVKFSALRTELDKCSFESRQMIAFVAQRNMYVSAIILSEDVFDGLCYRALPEFYVDHSGFFNSEFCEKNTEEEIHVEDMLKPRQKKAAINKKISRDDMIEAIKDMSIIKALSVFRFVSQKCVAVDSEARFDSRVENECIKETMFIPKKAYYFSWKELPHLSQELEDKSRSMVQKSNEGAGIRNIDKRFKFTEDDIVLFKSKQKDLPCLQDAVFTQAQITVDLAAPTLLQRIMDNALIGVPFVAVVILAPSWVASQTTGLLQGAGGCVAAALGCCIIGQGIVPTIDSYNSGYRQLMQWFGGKNCKPITKGWQYALLGSMNYIAAILAETLWGCNSALLRNIGGVIHGTRVLVSLYVMSIMENYGNPFKRSNAQGVPFNFGNLLSGPKFDSPNTK